MTPVLAKMDFSWLRLASGLTLSKTVRPGSMQPLPTRPRATVVDKTAKWSVGRPWRESTGACTRTLKVLIRHRVRATSSKPDYAVRVNGWAYLEAPKGRGCCATP